VQGAADRPAAAIGHEQQASLAQAFAQKVEKWPGQIGLAPFARAGVPVELPEGFPFRGPDLGPAQRPDFQPLDRRRAFLADLLALAAGQSGEKVLESPVAAIVPVELEAAAD